MLSGTRLSRLRQSEYLRMSYYEKWFTALTERLVRSGLITRGEAESGRPAPGSAKATPPLTAAQVPAMLRSGAIASRDSAVTPRFQAGQRVHTRNMNPTGHTRLPRYARDKPGTVERDHGVYVFPDALADSPDEKPQHVYSVRFSARELWGEQARAGDAVYIDLWDDYLEPA